MTPASVTEYQGDTLTTDHDVPMPATVAAGDLLLMLVTGPKRNASTPTGWTTIYSDQTGDPRSYVFAKDADGTEGGTTVTVTLSSSNNMVAQTYRILAADWEGTLADGVDNAAVASGTSTAPDPPSLSPAWGAVAGTLFIAIGHAYNTSDIAISSGPTGYSGLTTTSSHVLSEDALVSSAYLEANTTTEDPDAFTLDASSVWRAGTVAVQPSAGGLDNARLADLAFSRGRMRFGPGRLPVPDGTID